MRPLLKAVATAAFVTLTGYAAVREFRTPTDAVRAFRTSIQSAPTPFPQNVTVIPPSGGGSAYRLDPGCAYPEDGNHPPAYYINGGKPKKLKPGTRLLHANFSEQLFENEWAGGVVRDGHVHQFVDQLFQGRSGVFMESGAHDGCRESHTVWLEHRRKWEGILVEANPGLFKKLVGLNRNAWGVQACLPIKDGVHYAEFAMHGALGGIVDTLNVDHVKHIRKFVREAADVDSGESVPATCVPFDMIVRRANFKLPLDLWVLDVEGAELLVLRSTLKHTSTPAKVIVVEHNAGEPKRSEVHAILSPHYHRFLAEHMDDWYVAKPYCGEFGKCFDWPERFIRK